MATVPSIALSRPLVFDRVAQIKTAVVTLAFLAAFYNTFLELAHRWRHESDWSHGPIIPLFSLWFVSTHWKQIRVVPLRHTWIGLALMVVGLAVYQYSFWGLVVGYIRLLAMLVCLVGVVVFLCGLPVLRYVWLPLAYLLFALPLPKRIYFAWTDPLRRIAAAVAASVLDLLPNLDIQKAGSVIEYFYRGKYDQIGVADACSGMRSTMTLCALGVAVTYLSDRPWWHRVTMVAACVPIAVFCNTIRVTITCALYIFVDPKYATGNYHMVLGLVMLFIAFGLFSLLGWVLSNLTIEEHDAEGASAPHGG